MSKKSQGAPIEMTRSQGFRSAVQALHSAFDRTLESPGDPEAERLLRLLLEVPDYELPSC